MVRPALDGIAQLASQTGRAERARVPPSAISAAPEMEPRSRPFILGGRRDSDSRIRVADRMHRSPMGPTDQGSLTTNLCGESP